MASLNEGRETPTITRRRHVLACARCRARRVKCDRAQPACSNCSKAGALCRPAQQQSGPSPTSLSSHSSTRDSHESTRLQKLEETVARLSREVDSNSPSREPSTTPSPEESEDTRAQTRGQVVHGPTTRYLGPYSWALVSESLVDITKVLGGDHSSVVDLPPTPGDHDQSSLMIDDHLHELLLSIFSHRVDPLIRLLHWPSFLQRCHIFRRASSSQVHQSPNPQFSNPYYSGASFNTSPQTVYSRSSESAYSGAIQGDSSDYTFKALLSSVYYAAIVAVIDSPNPPELGHNINAFRLAATFKKEVSIRALDCKDVNCLGSLEMLQAIVLYMSVEPTSDDLQMLWYQHGVAVRVAQGLGIHRDGSHFDFGPIEIETRRRIWAQLCILDVRFAEQLGREPSITQHDYDSILPLSIDDRDLSDIEEQDSASRRGQDVNFKTHREIEQAQEQLSPFSLMSFTLVQAEVARLMSKLLVIKYRARDATFYHNSDSSELNRRLSNIATSRAERALWISRLEHRFSTVYEFNSLDASPKQYLVAELINISIEKAKFVARMIEWKEANAVVGISHSDPEHTRLFRDAISLSGRSLALLSQYSTSPYSWYTKRLREVYTSSCLAFSLASGRSMDQQDLNSAWSVLDQLYPVDATGRLVEQGISGSALGKVLLKARVRKEPQLAGSNAHALRNQVMHSATGNIHEYTTTMAGPSTVTLPTSTEGGTFQSSGNMFEDFDALMHDPLWSSGLTGMEHPYVSWERYCSR
ncbi:hypothetical protein P154DRAFT_328190 [Amniculicola lignicola CBS 123094]|uniref:Zn(2)-C6 fungal-type domain-containing protein n=1 Tax=Amniculicola lignicola CBS 123094 TaxID=1392246 RepID=A0A6A5W2A5_9PLEO|nr:hypothetical protein P154DRAFT_328190 [Amniculicola lignicola CBS 123094]